MTSVKGVHRSDSFQDRSKLSHFRFPARWTYSLKRVSNHLIAEIVMHQKGVGDRRK